MSVSKSPLNFILPKLFIYFSLINTWACVVFLWVINKEGLCPSSGDINRLMMKHMGMDQITLGGNIHSVPPNQRINLS
jgi:hypothetical protein